MMIKWLDKLKYSNLQISSKVSLTKEDCYIFNAGYIGFIYQQVKPTGIDKLTTHPRFQAATCVLVTFPPTYLW